MRLLIQDFPKCKYSSWIKYLSRKTSKADYTVSFQGSLPDDPHVLLQAPVPFFPMAP